MIKGVTKNVKLQVQFGGMLNDPWGNEKAGFTVTGKINRSDWGLVWNTAIEAGGLMVSDAVTKMLQGRLLSYPDAHRYRLGWNYENIPVNKCPYMVNNYQRDGLMQVVDFRADVQLAMQVAKELGIDISEKIIAHSQK